MKSLGELLLLLFFLLIRFTVVFLSKPCIYDSRHLEGGLNSFYKLHLLLSVESVSVVQCAHLCFFTHQEQCRSFNYNKKTKSCKLNSKNFRDEPRTVYPFGDFKFYQTKLFSKKFLDGYGNNHCLDRGPCGKCINFYNLICYEVITNVNENYNRAALECNRKSGHLAILPTRSHLESLHVAMETAGQMGTFFIGMDDQDGDRKWKWVDNTPVGMSRPPWDVDQPDRTQTQEFGEEGCGAIDFTRPGIFVFNDVPCALKWNFICQYKPWTYPNW